LCSAAPLRNSLQRGTRYPILATRYSQLGTRSAGMPDVHHVAILHDVVFAFEAERAFGAGVGFGAGFEQLIPADGFGADEMFFEVGVDGPGSLLRAAVGGDGPSAALIFSGGEKRNQ